MKKEYKAPILSIVNAEVECPMMGASRQGEWVESKKNDGIFVDDEEDVIPAAPKKLWDDEE